MDKLETFFIKTVTAAQQREQPTSGAVGTTQIGDFLASLSDEESRSAKILDKLVSAPLSHQSPAEPPKTEQVVPVETSEPKPGRQEKIKENILDKLTESSEKTRDEGRETRDEDA
jgi:hypothetical protein